MLGRSDVELLVLVRLFAHQLEQVVVFFLGGSVRLLADLLENGQS